MLKAVWCGAGVGVHSLALCRGALPRSWERPSLPRPCAQVLLGVAGFLQYKVALLLATLLPDEVDERMKELVDDVNYEVREKLQGRK